MCEALCEPRGLRAELSCSLRALAGGNSSANASRAPPTAKDIEPHIHELFRNEFYAAQRVATRAAELEEVSRAITAGTAK